MWYKRAKKHQIHSTYNGYMSYGHDFTYDRTNNAPQQPNDAIWVFRNGSLNVTTAQEWFNKGNPGSTFLHDHVFGEDAGGLGNPNLIKGRYDSKRNIITVISPDIPNRLYNNAIKFISKRYPTARVMEFAS